jgi:glycosyltransferase involved in cell wall biosynthesis
LPEPPEESGLRRPRLGYFGVIDERVDLEILDTLAAVRPEWEVVLVGPVVKVDPATLPRRANLHWLGSKPYDALPSHLASWDVCLLPFALNDATRYISPTKTLEYMAAEKPIVSTPIVDVERPYGHVVRIAAGPDAFVAACDEALGADADDRERRAADMRAVLEKTSWDATVAGMERLLDAVPTRAGGEHALAEASR